jgi:hypothetical protein
VHCDSTGAIRIALDPVKHELTKHVEVDCLYVRSTVPDKIIALQYVPSEIQLANLLPRLILELSIVFSFPNSMYLIHLEFKVGGGGVLEYIVVSSLPKGLCVNSSLVHLAIGIRHGYRRSTLLEIQRGDVGLSRDGVWIGRGASDAKINMSTPRFRVVRAAKA